MIDTSANVVAVIPARGGSKGIPGKNVLPIAGKPLISWTIGAVAEASTSFRLVVSTDCAEIAEISRKLGAEVVERPSELALDDSPTEPVIAHTLEELHVALDSCLVILQATSPIRAQDTLDHAYSDFVASGSDTLIAVVEESPFIWSGPEDEPRAHYEVGQRPRRQDFRPESIFYREVGSFYFSWVGQFLNNQNRIHGQKRLYVVSKYEGIDIDEFYDVAVAEAVLGSMNLGPV